MTGCLPPCSGLMLTSFYKNEKNKNFDHLTSNELIGYKKMTKWHNFPSELKGFEKSIPNISAAK